MAVELHSHESNTSAMGGRVFSLPDAIPSSAPMRAKAIPGPERLFRYRVLKRCLDVFLIAASAPIWLLLMAIIAAAVRLSSPGPIFFSHRRIRRHGAFFSMWKFRTMCVNSSEVLDSYLAAHPQARAEWRKSHKLKSDPRVTRVGNFLRRTSLDELPQLWNVFTGSMSLVGPGPSSPLRSKNTASSLPTTASSSPVLQVCGKSRDAAPSATRSAFSWTASTPATGPSSAISKSWSKRSLRLSIRTERTEQWFVLRGGHFGSRAPCFL